MKTRIRLTSMTQTVGTSNQYTAEVELEIDHETGITPEQMSQLVEFFDSTEKLMIEAGLNDL